MTAPRIGRLAITVALLASLVACSGAAPSEDKDKDKTEDTSKPGPDDPGLHEGLVISGDKTYDVYVPEKNAGKPRPAVLVLHGMPGDGPEARDQSQLDVLAEEEGFLAVYPSNPEGSWDTDTDGTADLEFVEDVITSVTDDFDADPKRIYVSGVSNGGDMALAVGARLPKRVAAVAAVVPAGTGEIAEIVADAEKPVSAIAFLGNADPRMSLGWGLMETWQDRADCGKAKTDKGKGVTVDRYDCAGDVTVEVQDVDGSHHWFGDPEEPEPVWASAAMWEFFTETAA